MPSRFELQIVDRETGQVVVTWAPQKPETTGPVIDVLCARLRTVDHSAADLEALCDRVRARGVGLGKSEAHVLADLRDAWNEGEEQRAARREAALRLAWQDALHELKSRV